MYSFEILSDAVSEPDGVGGLRCLLSSSGNAPVNAVPFRRPPAPRPVHLQTPLPTRLRTQLQIRESPVADRQGREAEQEAAGGVRGSLCSQYRCPRGCTTQRPRQPLVMTAQQACLGYR